MTLLPVLLGIHTLPVMSIAMPAGLLPVPVYPVEGDTAMLVLLITIAVPFDFATHFWTAPSTATATGLLIPPLV
jgi:hypothetical protein